MRLYFVGIRPSHDLSPVQLVHVRIEHDAMTESSSQSIRGSLLAVGTQGECRLASWSGGNRLVLHPGRACCRQEVRSVVRGQNRSKLRTEQT